jgi:uncharacterized MAPEG superfamily protein
VRCWGGPIARSAISFRNLLETFPIFAVLALALVITGRNGGLGPLGAQVWIAMRILYVPLYLVQIPFARSVIWFVSILALVRCWCGWSSSVHVDFRGLI